MIFNIINPCDPYTMEATDLEVAAVAVFVIGKGMFGLEEVTGDKSGKVPLFPLCSIGEYDDCDAWFKRNFDRGIKESTEFVSVERTEDLCKCLASVTIGDIKNRRAMEELLKRADTHDDFFKALCEMHDAARTSENDIGRTAWTMADIIAGMFVKRILN